MLPQLMNADQVSYEALDQGAYGAVARLGEGECPYLRPDIANCFGTWNLSRQLTAGSQWTAKQ